MRTRILFFATALAAFAPACASSPDDAINEYDDEATDGKADGYSTESTYYSARPDLRRCVSPVCGGLWVKRAGRTLTKCANGQYAAECYVAEADYHRLSFTGDEASSFNARFSSGQALVRGSLGQKSYGSFGSLGVLTATEAWRAASDHAPTGRLYRVTDSGVECITTPCPTLHAAQLNWTTSRNFTDLGLDAVAASDDDVSKAWDLVGRSSVLVAGAFKTVYHSGPAGNGTALVSSQLYLPVKHETATTKCYVGGCSSQICSSQQGVISTCEWRAEYACYRGAECTVQADGQCGWTQTDALKACLASPPPL
jgi:hypothetical protein